MLWLCMGGGGGLGLAETLGWGIFGYLRTHSLFAPQKAEGSAASAVGGGKSATRSCGSRALTNRGFSIFKSGGGLGAQGGGEWRDGEENIEHLRNSQLFATEGAGHDEPLGGGGLMIDSLWRASQCHSAVHINVCRPETMTVGVEP
jgi:hypothetical protein